MVEVLCGNSYDRDGNLAVFTSTSQQQSNGLDTSNALSNGASRTCVAVGTHKPPWCVTERDRGN